MTDYGRVIVLEGRTVSGHPRSVSVSVAAPSQETIRRKEQERKAREALSRVSSALDQSVASTHDAYRDYLAGPKWEPNKLPPATVAAVRADEHSKRMHQLTQMLQSKVVSQRDADQMVSDMLKDEGSIKRTHPLPSLAETAKEILSRPSAFKAALDGIPLTIRRPAKFQGSY